MMRTLLPAAALLLAVALPAAAQQFRVERDFDVLRRPDGRARLNIYWVSLPLLPDVPDVANTAASNRNKCVGDVTGPAVGDGLLNADDLICAWWTARSDLATAGTFTVTYLRPEECTPINRTGSVALGAPGFSGTVFPLVPDAGYQVLVTVPWGTTFSPRNHAVLEGDHDDTWPGLTIDYSPTCAGGATTNCCGASAPRLELITYPYHAMPMRAIEIHCGLEGVDWSDADSNGAADTCWSDGNANGRWDPGEPPTGIFDGTSPITVSTVVNGPDYEGPLSLTATTALGRFRMTGTDFELTPGEAYQVRLNSRHRPTIWLPAHF